jgi:hypothetical protein
VLLVCLPISLWRRPTITGVSPHGNAAIHLEHGALTVWVYSGEQPLGYAFDDFWVANIAFSNAKIREHALWPWWRSNKVSIAEDDLSIPLWLLATICLAWPVTALLLARRRRKGRGFAVEPASGAAPPAIDPPPHHPSNLPPP